MSAVPTVQATYKEDVRCASTANIASLSAPGAVDGITLAVGDSVLLKDQATLNQNGIYYWNGSTLTRRWDAGILNLLTPGHEVYVAEGTANGKTKWNCVTTGLISPGSTNILYTRTFPDYEALWKNPWDPSALGDNIERETATSTFTQTSGTLYCYGGMVLRAGLTYSALNVFFTSAGATVTHTWAGLVVPTGNAQWGTTRQLIAVSADNTAAPTAGAFRTFTFGAAITPNYDTPVYFALLLAATTVPAVAASPAVPSAALLGAVPILSGSSTTGLTTPQAVNTAETALTAITQTAYAYLT